MMRTLLKTFLALLVLLIAGLYLLARNAPEPQTWHTVNLDEEFTADKLEDMASFADYLALEDRLFLQLDREVYATTPRGPEHSIERYSKGSAADPTSRTPNWNRSFELHADNPRGAVLLLHGMSDSPYSLRALGLALNQQGYKVLGLRLPGHGTAPSGLKAFVWEDMSAAVQLAMQHLQAEVGRDRVHMIGYSNGAPLSLDFALKAELDPMLGSPASLVLISPAVGISPAAALAKWSLLLSGLPGLEHLAWIDMLPEFDPYKYNSFATNAAKQVRRLTVSVAERIKRRQEDDPAPPFPPVLVMKSTIDATVSTYAVVEDLLMRLEKNRHEYVLFDINRQAIAASLLVSDPGPLTNKLLKNPALPFTLTVIGNETVDSPNLIARQKSPDSLEIVELDPLDTRWPPFVLSLSHVAMPFPPDDPQYGRENPGLEDEIFLGHVALQGERGLMVLSGDWLIRMRHNPFYEYLERRAINWIENAGEAGAAPQENSAGETIN